MYHKEIEEFTGLSQKELSVMNGQDVVKIINTRMKYMHYTQANDVRKFIKDNGLYINEGVTKFKW